MESKRSIRLLTSPRVGARPLQGDFRQIEDHLKLERLDVELEKARRAVMEALGQDWPGSPEAMEVEEVLLDVMTGRRRTGRERPAQVETAQRYRMF
jgi:hypothetical protein